MPDCYARAKSGQIINAVVVHPASEASIKQGYANARTHACTHAHMLVQGIRSKKCGFQASHACKLACTHEHSLARSLVRSHSKRAGSTRRWCSCRSSSCRASCRPGFRQRVRTHMHACARTRTYVHARTACTDVHTGMAGACEQESRSGHYGFDRRGAQRSEGGSQTVKHAHHMHLNSTHPRTSIAKICGT